MLDLNDMLLFAKVVDAGSFTAAAKQLGIPKSTMSRRISQFEAELGIRLLHRTTRSLKLTELGAVFHERCKRVLLEAEEAERAIHHGQQDPKGLLRISAPVETGIDLLGHLIADYMKQYPKVQVELDLSNRFVDLIEEGYDIAIRAGRLEDSSLIARKLTTGRQVICANSDYLQQMGTPTHPEALHDHHTLLYKAGNRHTALEFQQGESVRTVTLKPRFTTNNHFTLRDAALSSLGIAIMPAMVCRAELEQGLLVNLLEDWQLEEQGIYALYPSPRHLTPKVISFLDYLRDHFPD